MFRSACIYLVVAAYGCWCIVIAAHAISFAQLISSTVACGSKVLAIILCFVLRSLSAKRSTKEEHTAVCGLGEHPSRTQTIKVPPRVPHLGHRIGPKREVIDMNQNQSSSEVLTVNEIAGYLRVSETTVWRWCNTGKLPAFRIGRSWRIRRADLEQHIKQSVAEPELYAESLSVPAIDDRR